MAEPFLSVNASSDYTGLPTSVLGHAAALDPPRLRSFKVAERGHRWFRKSDLDAFMAAYYNGPSSPAPQRKRRSRQKVDS